MIGFGNAGRALAKILLEKQQEILDTQGWQLKVVAIATGSRGNLVDEEGIDLAEALEDLSQRGFFHKDKKGYSHWTTMDLVEKVDYDVLIEITPLNIFSGEPAIQHIKGAMHRKKHVITANKGPIAWAYRELRSLADKQHLQFFFETTVMDGTPIFNLVQETLPMCKVLEVNGILNTTTNFVLEEMNNGRTFEEAIAEGKRRGFVEANPAMDIEGWDAAAKTAALLNVFMDAKVTPLDIERKGIEEITPHDLLQAEKEGKKIKLVCHGKKEGDKVMGKVYPAKVDKGHVFSTITGTSSVLTLKTDLMGEVTILEHDPEIQQTGYGLFSDLLRLIKALS